MSRASDSQNFPEVRGTDSNSPMSVQHERLEEQIARMTEEADRSTEDIRWLMSDLVHAKLQLSKAHKELSSLRAEVEHLRLQSPTYTTAIPPPQKKQRRARIGIYTPAELTVLGEDALSKLDERVLELSVQDLDEQAFQNIFRQAGAARVRPHHYEMSEREAGARFGDTGLDPGERCYWGMVQSANTLVERQWSNAWWVDRMLFRITLMDYLEWRGIEGPGENEKADGQERGIEVGSGV